MFYLEIHQKNAKPDCRRLETLATRSIEQDLRKRNFEARNGRELNQTRWSKIKGNNVVFTKETEFVDGCKSVGSVRKETIAVSGTMT